MAFVGDSHIAVVNPEGEQDRENDRIERASMARIACLAIFVAELLHVLRSMERGLDEAAFADRADLSQPFIEIRGTTP